jgi:hypothetical protein
MTRTARPLDRAHGGVPGEELIPTAVRTAKGPRDEHLAYGDTTGPSRITPRT